MVMIGAKKYPRLEATSGSKAGKHYQLRKGEYSLGTHKRCQIKLTGDYVSELHAVVKQNSEGVWTLTNNSPNGTFVNNVQVDSVELNQISTIQIGAENSFAFKPSNAEFSAEGDSENDAENPKPGKTNKWIWIAGLVALVYLPGFFYLKQMGDNLVEVEVERSSITISAIQRVSDESREFLSDYQSHSGSRRVETPGTSSAAGLYEKLVMGAYEGQEEKDELINRIVEKSRSYLTTAHHYEKMQLTAKAKEALRLAIAVFPDYRNPASAFASGRISALKPRTNGKGS